MTRIEFILNNVILLKCPFELLGVYTKDICFLDGNMSFEDEISACKQCLNKNVDSDFKLETRK